MQGDDAGEVGGALVELARQVRHRVQAHVGGRIVDVDHREPAGDPHGPFDILPPPAGEAGVEGFDGEDVAPDQQVGGVDVFLGRPGALGGADAFAGAGQGAVDGEAAVAWRLFQRETAEGHGGVVARNQIDPGLEKAGAVRLHVAVEEQPGAGAGGDGQAIAPARPAFIGGQGDEAGGQGQGVQRRLQPGGQGGVARAVVQQDQLDPAGQGGAFGIQPAQQGLGIVAQEGDQDRQFGPGGGPAGVVVDIGAGAAHAGAPRRVWISRYSTSRTPAALSVSARAA